MTNHQLPPFLNLVYLNFRITLAMTVFAFVLLTAFFLENNDLFAAAVADDRGFDRAAVKTRLFVVTDEKGFEFDLFAFFFFNCRYAKGVALFNAELLSACSDNCVTHFLL